jgi:hypothetical protein
VSARILRNGKPLADRVAVIAEDRSIKVGKALAKTDALEVTLDTTGLKSVAAFRVEALPQGAETMALGKAVTVSLTVVGANGQKRKISFGAGEATAKRAIHRGGAEVFGLGSEWRLPREVSSQPWRATWLLESPLVLAEGEKILLSVGGDNTLPVRFDISPLGAVDPLEASSVEVLQALSVRAAKRSKPQAQRVLDTWLMSVAADRAAYDQNRKLFAAVRNLDHGRTWSLVTQAAQPLTVRVLPRGNWQDETGAVVLPSTPSFLPARLESTPDRRLTRLDLARWIVSKDNPITARAVTNRLWQQFFGIGLSAAVDDLGSQGELPSHPELLEWLASEFRDSGWDVKHMIRLIVTSRTYRQSSSLRPELKDTDPLNRLLASQNPRRLDAEFVRDNALFIAGGLNLDDIGGPSVKPYQPDGYYDALQFPDRKYVASTGAEQWRRGVYMHWQRTFLHPMLANFDAPARDECAALRTVSNTPQQALTLLNDPTFVEAARLFAARLLGDKAAVDDGRRFRRAYLLAMAREPKPAEAASLKNFLAAQREYYRAHPDDAAKLVKIGSAPPSQFDAAELAAWTNLCRVVLNAQETITRY